MKYLLIFSLLLTGCSFQGPAWRLAFDDGETAAEQVAVQQNQVNQRIGEAINDHAKRLEYLLCKVEPEHEDCKEEK